MRPDSVYRSIAHGNHCMRMDHACTWPTSAYKEGEKMKFRVIVSAVVLTLLSTAAFAQDAKRPPESRPEQTPQANPFSTFNKIAYARIKTILVSSAEKMRSEERRVGKECKNGW